MYGADPGLRAGLERRAVGYVLAVAVSHPVTTAATTRQARMFPARLPRRAWQRYSAGAGAKGHRFYDWAWLAIDPGCPSHRWLLVRRSRRRPAETMPTPPDRVFVGEGPSFLTFEAAFSSFFYGKPPGNFTGQGNA